jgi:hypothetical protein
VNNCQYSSTIAYPKHDKSILLRRIIFIEELKRIFIVKHGLSFRKRNAMAPTIGLSL